MDRQERIDTTRDLSAFANVVRHYQTYTKKALQGYHFTPNEVATMIFLLEETDMDTAKEFSNKYGVTQSLVCRSVDSLTRRKLITAEQDRLDRRVNHLSLNLDDENLEKILTELNCQYMDTLMEGINKEDRETFLRVLRTIQDRISE